MRLRLIGQMEAWTLTSESVLPTGRKTRGLLAVIALSAPRPVLRGRVAEMLWSRRPEEQARASLRQEIHRLLAALDPLGSEVLAITRDHLSLRPGAVWVDVDEVLRATPARPATLGLFDGDLLEDLDGVDPAFDNWLAGERERLRDRARALGETLLREQTEPEPIIAAAQQLLRIDRSHEQAWRALMRAYAARGDRGMAIQAYERCRAVLAEQLDAQPSNETQRLLGELKSNPALRPGVDTIRAELRDDTGGRDTGGRDDLGRHEGGRHDGGGRQDSGRDDLGRNEMERTDRGEPDRGLMDRPTDRKPDRGPLDLGATDNGGRGETGPVARGGDAAQGGSATNDAGRNGLIGGVVRTGSLRTEPGRTETGRGEISRGEPLRAEFGRGQAPPVRTGRANGRNGGRGGDDIDDGGQISRGDGRGDPRTASPRGGVRVGVLPLNLIGTSVQEAHLSTGLADEITSALARFRWMFLVSSSSLARFSTQTRDEAALRRAFGLDVVLDGSVQRSGERLRVSMRLLDLRASNQVVWSGRFDRSADDLLTLQDDIAAEVVAQIDPEILLIESQRACARPLSDPTAYDLLLRALPLIPRFERPVFMQAGELLARAIVLEPDYAAAHAWYAYWYIFLVGQAWCEDPVAGMAEAGRLAERAVMLDPQDGKALTIAGHVRAFLHHRLRDGLTLHERALTLNPNLAMAWNLSGVAYAYLGDYDEAERRVARYKQLSPLDPQAFFFDTARIIIALMRHRHDQAAEIGREVTEMNPAFSASLKPYLAALGHLGDKREANVVRARLLNLEPGFTVTRMLSISPFEREEDRAHFAEGLRLAGVAEE